MRAACRSILSGGCAIECEPTFCNVLDIPLVAETPGKGRVSMAKHAQHRRDRAYWVNFHVGEFESTSTIVVAMPEKRHGGSDEERWRSAGGEPDTKGWWASFSTQLACRWVCRSTGGRVKQKRWPRLPPADAAEDGRSCEVRGRMAEAALEVTRAGVCVLWRGGRVVVVRGMRSYAMRVGGEPGGSGGQSLQWLVSRLLAFAVSHSGLVAEVSAWVSEVERVGGAPALERLRLRLGRVLGSATAEFGGRG